MDTLHHELSLLSRCYQDPAIIDLACQHNITAAHFNATRNRYQWKLMVELRVAGEAVDAESIITHAQKQGMLDACGGLAGIMEASSASPTTFTSMAPIDGLNDAYSRKMVEHGMNKISEKLKAGLPLSDIALVLEQTGECITTGKKPHRSLKDISKSVISQAKQQIEGTNTDAIQIFTGLPTFDKYATPIMPHEYVVVGGRTSHGKSSLMAQIAGHNLTRNMRVAYYTIETSAEAVLRQIAAQMTGTNFRFIQDEMPDNREAYLKEVDFLGNCNRLMIFDNVLTLDSLIAHGRMLATSFKPHLVVLDYLNIVGCSDGGQYEQMTKVSKGMIPFRKSLNCALIAGAQFNRGPEKDERRPQRTDFRDSGSIEEDAHRLMAVWRKPNQPLDNQYFDCEVMQLKLRDGPLAGINARFNSRTTKFFEASHDSTH